MGIAHHNQRQLKAIVHSYFRMDRTQEGARRHDSLEIIEQLRPGKLAAVDLAVPIIFLLVNVVVFREIGDCLRGSALFLQIGNFSLQLLDPLAGL